jgi:light-regulated signal transduction histidine kinase (bacteriophytochrome)
MPKPDTIHEKEKEVLSVNRTLSQNRIRKVSNTSAPKKPEQYTKKKEKWLKQVIDEADINTFTWEQEMVMDNTEQEKAKEKLERIVLERTRELLRLNTELEKSNRELEQFAYIASHDLQEPLRKIQTFVDLIKNHLNDKVTAERYFNKINSSAQRMSMLINDVLNYSRLAKTGEQFVRTDLNKILKQVLNDFELLIEQKQAVITYDKLLLLKAFHYS